MLGENLKALRKQKGMSQEVMAQQLNVVRQTVSKWEQGLSVPDAQMLTNIAELFEVPVSSLLGESIEENVNVNEIAVQLAVFVLKNTQMGTFFGQLGHDGTIVGVPHAQQDDQARPDFARLTAVDGDAGMGNALDDGSHNCFLSFSSR